MTILCIGDAHLGRYPSRVSERPTDIAVGKVWETSVTYAIQHAVDAVVLTGDIVDNKNGYFEAFGPLKHGIGRLVRSNIPVYAVAGNHDYNVLPRLIDDVEGITLLGPKGTWSTAMLKTKSGQEACLVGWSFPSAHCESSPLESLTLPNVDMPIIGVVHGDLNATKNTYAPLPLSELQQQRVAVWLLGHVHVPTWIDGPGTPVLYTGSLQALDPGEPGTHGPWLITIPPSGPVKAQQLPLATVRYESVDINISGQATLDDIDSLITQNLQRRADQLATQFSPHLKRTVFRPKLTGRTSLYRDLARRPWNEITDLDITADRMLATVDKIILDLQPDHDLNEISRFGDPPAILAQWLLDLKQQGSETLIQEAHTAVQKVCNAKMYTELGDKEPDLESITTLLIQQGALLLDELMSQKTHE